MSKILINNIGFDVEIADVGVTVASSSQYTIPPQDYAVFAASSDVINKLSLQELILNDGGVDITLLSQAVDIIKGWPIQPIADEVEPFFFDFADELIGAGPHVVYSQSFGPGFIITLTRISLSCRIESMLEVFKNGIVIASLRTGAAMPRDNFDWREDQELINGDSLEIVLTKRSGGPDNRVGVHLMGNQTAI